MWPIFEADDLRSEQLSPHCGSGQTLVQMLDFQRDFKRIDGHRYHECRRLVERLLQVAVTRFLRTGNCVISSAQAREVSLGRFAIAGPATRLLARGHRVLDRIGRLQPCPAEYRAPRRPDGFWSADPRSKDGKIVAVLE
jgi:hypothetical protein